MGLVGRLQMFGDCGTMLGERVSLRRKLRHNQEQQKSISFNNLMVFLVKSHYTIANHMGISNEEL